MNCGFCGRPVYDGQPICEGCRKSRVRSGVKKQRKFDREHKLQEKWEEMKEPRHTEEAEEEEDARDVWAKK